jgi:acetoin utilization deacetylase AcuC-like enzyme
VLVVHDPRTLAHAVPPGFPERPERVSRLVQALAVDPRFELREGRGASSDEAALAAVETVHDAGYVERFRRAVARGDGLLDSADNPLSAGTFDAALAAARATLVALEHVLAHGAAAFAAVRPPGHHAERAQAMGFCYFNHAAVAAERALSAAGCERVAIVDVDVHHGNGTQHLFEARADVLYASAHQYPFYPGTGAAGERGRGAGAGLTVNVPLAAGGGDDEWLAALDGTILPAVERFAPELLVVSAGFDAWRGDPVGGMRVSEAGFAAMGRRLGELAERRCGGRRLLLLEGGYDVAALPRLVRALSTGREAEAAAAG